MSDRVVAKCQRITIGLFQGEKLRTVELTVEKINEMPIVNVTINAGSIERITEISHVRDVLSGFGYVFHFSVNEKDNTCIVTLYLPGGISFIDDFLCRLVDSLKNLPWKTIYIDDHKVIFEVDGKEMTVKEFLQHRLNIRKWIVAYGGAYACCSSDFILGQAEGPDMTEETAMQIIGVTRIEQPEGVAWLKSNVFVRFIDEDKQTEVERTVASVYDEDDPRHSIVLVETTQKD